ncbi:MAG TPA: SIR2 family protein [Pyrinomonadaceae bacterium]|nr:SIR2 family protein [Pyrinomonadaceae bacterium]
MPIPVNEIVASLKERNCIFLLGPGLVLDKKGGLLQAGLIDYFKEKGLEIDQDLDNLFSCKTQAKTRAHVYIKEYYRDNGELNDTLRQLARIPGHLYVSINPDLLMKQALEDYGVAHEFKYYVKDQPPEDVTNPTAEKPLLYNLCGSIDTPQSLIFSYEDLIQYLFSIVRDFKLPQNLRSNLENNVYFIFLGFDFEKWYLKLLLKLLLLDETKLSIAAESGTGTQGQLRTFYVGHYGLEFVEDNVEQYVKRLYDECDQQGLLRVIKEKTQASIQDEIKELINNDELEQALDRLYQTLSEMDEQLIKAKDEEKQDLLDELDMQISRLSRSEKQLRKGLVTEEDAAIEKNKITEAVLTNVRKLFG